MTTAAAGRVHLAATLLAHRGEDQLNAQGTQVAQVIDNGQALVISAVARELPQALGTVLAEPYRVDLAKRSRVLPWSPCGHLLACSVGVNAARRLCVIDAFSGHSLVEGPLGLQVSEARWMQIRDSLALVVRMQARRFDFHQFRWYQQVSQTYRTSDFFLCAQGND